MSTTAFASGSALWQSFGMIIVSEIGDKTFLIAAILSMRHSPYTVFAGAFSALALMSLLSSVMGRVLPTLLPDNLTLLATAALFFFFSAKMLKEGLSIPASMGVDAELKDVTRELDEESKPDVELGRSFQPRLTQMQRVKKSIGAMTDPVFVQAAVMTFLGEWGDRSQMATIALASIHGVWIVTVGTVVGHGLCTLGACLGGKWISTKISVRTVTLSGAALFGIFGIVTLWEGWDIIMR